MDISSSTVSIQRRPRQLSSSSAAAAIKWSEKLVDEDFDFTHLWR
jgi:hypothetical protein